MPKKVAVLEAYSSQTRRLYENPYCWNFSQRVSLKFEQYDVSNSLLASNNIMAIYVHHRESCSLHADTFSFFLFSVGQGCCDLPVLVCVKGAGREEKTHRQGEREMTNLLEGSLTVPYLFLSLAKPRLSSCKCCCSCCRKHFKISESITDRDKSKMCRSH